MSLLRVILLFLLSLSSAASSPPPPPSCPMDMNYVLQIAWNKTLCLGYEPPQTTQKIENDTTGDPCCQSLVSLFGVALAKHLKDTSNFHLPSAATALSCLTDFQAKLTSLGLPNDVVSYCLTPNQFVMQPDLCAKIQTTDDWEARLGPTTELDSACRDDLTNLTSCDGCVTAGTKVVARLTSIDGNASHSRECWYFTVLYAAGIVNEFWPNSNSAFSCIFGMSMDSQSDLGPTPTPASNASLIFGLTGAGVAVFIMLSLLGLYFLYDRKWRRRKTEGGFDVEAFIRNYGSLAPNRYSYAQVKKMTNSFAENIGKGGYGAVYKGKLPDGCLVAVKMLNECKGNGEEFMNEVASIGRTSHVNVVTLLGFCLERKKRALVYEYMPNGSLDRFIFNRESSNVDSRLEWKTLYEIAVGIARGLEYLHRGCNTTILHFDIKPQNILLDKDLCPKISDFGLAKLWLKKENTVSMVGARGTVGYIAPEVFSRTYGKVSHKSDVYSYGMLVLEMVGGRKNFNSRVSRTSEIYFPNRIYKDLEMEDELSILSDTTEEEKELSMKMILVSFWCIQTNPSDRPSMSEVVDMLQGSLQSLEVPPKPFLFSPTRSAQQSPTPSL